MPDTDDESDEPVVACTLTADEVDERSESIRENLLPHYEGATELENGYRLAFAGSADVLTAVAEWVGEEAECCSFADFAIEYERPYDEVGLRFTGPAGTKALLEEGFVEAFDEVPAPS